jgi:hypothetical protein
MMPWFASNMMIFMTKTLQVQKSEQKFSNSLYDYYFAMDP